MESATTPAGLTWLNGVTDDDDGDEPHLPKTAGVCKYYIAPIGDLLLPPLPRAYTVCIESIK